MLYTSKHGTSAISVQDPVEWAREKCLHSSSLYLVSKKRAWLSGNLGSGFVLCASGFPEMGKYRAHN